MKVKIDNMQQNNKCKSCEEKVHRMIIKCNKLAQKEYKTRHDSVGSVVHWELCKRLKFEHTTKQCMPKPVSLEENET